MTEHPALHAANSLVGSLGFDRNHSGLPLSKLNASAGKLLKQFLAAQGQRDPELKLGVNERTASHCWGSCERFL